MSNSMTCKHYKQGDCVRFNPQREIYNCGDCEDYERKANEPEHDAVEHPAHYTSGGIECIDCIKAALGENFIGFLMGNVIKYSYRYKHKNGIEDLKKARWYLNRAIKEIGDERTE